jgi:hypothetical protein
MTKLRGWLVAGGILLAILVYNAWVAFPAATAMNGEHKVTAVVYRNALVDPTTIVFDLWNVRSDAAMTDVDRMLFKTAAGLKDKHFKSVILAYHGKGRFKLEGDEFHTIGVEWGDQNPIYVVRTLQEHITHMDGTAAFGVWTGGLLGVLSKEMEEHQELHMRWYILSMVGRAPDGPLPVMNGSSAP